MSTTEEAKSRRKEYYTSVRREARALIDNERSESGADPGRRAVRVLHEPSSRFGVRFTAEDALRIGSHPMPSLARLRERADALAAGLAYDNELEEIVRLLCRECERLTDDLRRVKTIADRALNAVKNSSPS